VRRLFPAAVALALSGFAQAQTNATLSDSVKAMVGTWEFSNAERDKTCTAKFTTDPARIGFRVTFDADCAKLFPLVRQIVGWKFPQEDLLYMLDARGKALMEFSEVEDGIYEAPTPGLGVLFLQNAAAAAASPKSEPTTGEVAGNWAVVRDDGTSICVLTLAKGGLAVTAQPGCDPSIVKFNFTQWRMDQDELVLIPANGDTLRFEDADGNWRQISDAAGQLLLVRQ
jgi:Protease inhibitor Inh